MGSADPVLSDFVYDPISPLIAAPYSQRGPPRCRPDPHSGRRAVSVAQEGPGKGQLRGLSHYSSLAAECLGDGLASVDLVASVHRPGATSTPNRLAVWTAANAKGYSFAQIDARGAALG